MVARLLETIIIITIFTDKQTEAQQGSTSGPSSPVSGGAGVWPQAVSDLLGQ